MSDNGLILLNGRTPGDLAGGFTFCGPQGFSTVDLISGNYEAICTVWHLRIDEVSINSDHFPFHLELRSQAPPDDNSNYPGQPSPVSTSPTPPPRLGAKLPKWSSEIADPFSMAMASSPMLRQCQMSSDPSSIYENLCVAIAESATAAGKTKQASPLVPRTPTETTPLGRRGI